VVLVEPEGEVVETEPEVETVALAEPETVAEIEAAVVLVEPEGEVAESEPEVEMVALVEAEPEGEVAESEPEVEMVALVEAEPEGEVAESEPEVEMVALVEVEPEGEVAETEPEVATVALAEPEGEVAETEPEVEMVALTESEVAVNASEATIENEAEDVAATVEIFNAALPSNGNGNKNNAPVWNALGNVFFNAAAFEEALMAYTRAIELDPDYGYAVHNLALTYVKTGRYQEALPLYNRGIDLLKDKHDKATSWNSLGNAYRMLDDYASAAKAYQAADELDPENLSLKVWTRSGLLSGTRI
ncbi:MAG: tetratricopeptide repeat protein, partial [Anaerolineales bacterium]|nr:tetratricopeptide repeat protein [Anaerolineales bacterium]